MNSNFFASLCASEHPLKDSEEAIYEPSETVPDMDMKPAEIIERCVRHLPVPISYRETFVLPDGLTEDQMLDYEPAEDKFDVMVRHRDLLADIERSRRKPKEKPVEPQIPPSEETSPES